MHIARRISPCLWFDDQAEEAVTVYVEIFSNSRISGIARYGQAGQEVHGRSQGTVMTVAFELDGLPFLALNGGPLFRFSEAISFQVHCDTQEEIDYFWERLGEGGDTAARQCGWLKDRFGLSWQIVPAILSELLVSAGADQADRLMAAVMRMTKLDIAEL
ncbi:MAG: VOC family protein, partial [Armatimonadetes bacterium]|nr:VOC family protein [Armatimonadota bacterium]